MKTLSVAYLYADGHAVCIYEKEDPQAGKVEWAEVFEKFGPACLFTGRIVLHRGQALFDLCRRAKSIRATVPDTKHGSENTRKAGIAIGYMDLQMGGDSLRDSIMFYDLPDLISGCYKYQPETAEDFDAKAYHWGNCRIAKLYRIKSKTPEPAELAAA